MGQLSLCMKKKKILTPDVQIKTCICNRLPSFAISVGGIYTVIRSKAGVTVEELGDQYILLGPYSEATVQTEVEIMEPENPRIRNVLRSMTDKGIKVRSKISVTSTHQDLIASYPSRTGRLLQDGWN